MDVTEYKARRAALEALADYGKRIPCPRCLQPNFGCYCELIQPFDPGIKFVILIHPKEIARRIATGRMAHLCLKNSHLIAGHDFTHNQSVNQILNDPSLHCKMLYPGAASANLSVMEAQQKHGLIPEGKKLTLFVIDGTWATARKTVNVSQNLKPLPRVCFTPNRPSQFRVRLQPSPECYSTIEAIHHTLDLLQPERNEQDHLLFVFGKMVARQLELAHSTQLTPWSELQL